MTLNLKIPPANATRLVSWNVNSIITLLSYHPWCVSGDIASVLDILHCDILCVQETKIGRSRLTKALACPEGFDTFWSFCNTDQKVGGYSGVATYARRGTVSGCTEGLTGLLPLPSNTKKVPVGVLSTIFPSAFPHPEF